MNITQKKRWSKGRKWISLILAGVLIVSMIPWGNFIVKAATDCQITIQTGDGTLSDIQYVKDGETDVTEGTPGEGGMSGIPVDAKVTFSVTPAQGKYLEKIECGTERISFTQEGTAYQATVTITEDMTLVCTYGTFVSNAQPDSYFSVKAVGKDGQETEAYSANGVYYSGENGLRIVPASGVSLKIGEETAYDSNARTYTEETTIQEFTVEKTVDSSVSYERVTLASGISLRIDKTVPEITGITFSGTGTSEAEWSKDSVVQESYGYYFKDSTTVKVCAKDDLSGVKSISCRLDGVDASKNPVSKTLDSGSLTGENGAVYAEFTIPANFKGRIYVYAADNVDNTGAETQPDGVIVEDDSNDNNVDIKDIVIQLPNSANKDDHNYPLYNKEETGTDGIEIGLEIKNTYSGMKEVSWELENGESVTKKTIQIDNQGNITGDETENWSIQQWDKNLVTGLKNSIKVLEKGNEIVLTVTMTDRTGHKLSKSATFAIDATAPTIECSCVPNAWTSGNVTAEFTPQDGAGSGIVHVYYAKKAEENETEVTEQNGSYSKQFTEENEEGTYECWAVDRAGNKSESREFVVSIDKTVPEITGITFSGEGTSEKEWSVDSVVQESYGYYFKDSTTVTVRAQDNLSGVKSISYRLVDVDSSKQPISGTLDRLTKEKNNEDVVSAEFTIPANFKGRIYVQATDCANNIGEEEQPDGVIVENGDEHGNSSTIQIELPETEYKDDNDNPAYNKEEIEIGLKVKDAYSGIKSVSWKLKNGTEETTKTIRLDNQGKIAGDDAENWSIVSTDENLVTKLSNKIEVSKEGREIVLTVTLTDRAGHITSSDKIFTIDRKDPEITGITFSGTGTSENGVEQTDYGYYFKDKTTVTVSAQDDLSGVKSISYRLVDVDASKQPISGTLDRLTKEENGVSAAFTIPANFKGRIYVYATDRVDRKCSEVQPNGVIVENDKTHKESASIQIELPETSCSDDKGLKLYNHDIEIPITAADTFSGLRKIEWFLKSDGDSGNNQSGSVEISNAKQLSGDANGWSITKSDSNLAVEMKKTLKVSSNSNDIALSITLTDRAGFTTTKEVKFSIDKTQPVISVTYNTSDSPSTSSDKNYKGFYKNGREAVITVKERNFNEEKANLVIEKTLKNKENVTISKWQSKDKLSGKSDDAVYTCTVTYQGNSAYNFSMTVTDLAGNETKYHKNGASDIFMVDKKKPTLNKKNLKISPKNSDTAKQYTDEKSIVWYNQNVTFSFTAKDGDAGLYQVSSSAFAMDGIVGKFSKHVNKTYGLEAYSVQEVDYGKRGEAEEQSYTVSTNTKKNKSEKYKLAVNAVDYAGNESAMESKVIGIDTQKPRITGITFEGVGNQDSSWKDTTVEEKDYGYYFREAATVKITATDASANGSSGLKAISYRLSDVNDKAERKYITPTLQTDEEEPYITVAIPKGFKGQIYAYATDNVGNQGNTEQPDGTVRESEEQAKEAKIEITSPATSYQDEDGRPLYASNTTFHILVEDIYSGLKKVEWEVESGEDDDSNQSGTVEIDNKGSLSDSEWKITGSDENLVTKLERNITVSNNSNHIVMKVTLTDRTGNVTEYNGGNGLAFSIDKTAPKIEVSYLENDPSNERYYNKDRTATITVTERNFDEEATNRLIQIMNTDSVIPAYGAWTHGGEKGTDRATHTCTITYAADGDYTFTMAAEDTAKNRMEYGNVDEFTIDKTNPVIDVSYSTDGLSNAIYYKDECVATITVTEHNFNNEGIVITQTAQLDGQTIAAPVNTGWSSNGDVHTATIHYNSDGDFTLNVAGQDLAANEAENYDGTKFVVDLTEPEIEITDIEDMTAYNGTVAPGVSFSDVNCDAESVKITLSGYKHDPQDLTGNMVREVHGGSIKLEDFAHTAEMDDVYTLTAQVTDLAGNSKEVSKVFSVNRFGSNYILGDETQKLIKQYYSNHEADLVIREVNVSSLETEDVTYSRDGEIVTLEKGKDYDVEEAGTEYASWKEYTYTIHADNFAEEGSYMVTVLSVDGAENSMTNRTAKTKEYTKEVEFVIDKTAPTSVISGVENNGRYTEAEREIKIDSQDNVAIDVVEVYLNDKGTPVLTWTQEELKENDGIMNYALQAASYWQNLRVVAVDKAGNRSESDTIRCLLTTNVLVQFLNNPFLIFGAVILAALAVGVGYWLIIVKRRKKRRMEN